MTLFWKFHVLLFSSDNGVVNLHGPQCMFLLSSVHQYIKRQQPLVPKSEKIYSQSVPTGMTRQDDDLFL